MCEPFPMNRFTAKEYVECHADPAPSCVPLPKYGLLYHHESLASFVNSLLPASAPGHQGMSFIKANGLRDGTLGHRKLQMINAAEV